MWTGIIGGVVGEGWGVEGPPPEAYERVSDPERFRGLHAAGRELLDELSSTYRVRRETFVDDGRPHAPEPGVTLHPEQPGAASLGLTFTEAPGLVPWYAGRRHGHLPLCACDACDTTLEECVRDLRDLAESVVTGSFGERLTIDGDRWWHTTWTLVGPTGHRAESARPVDDAEAERLLERMPDGYEEWTPWSRRPSTVASERGGVDVGTVRRWSDHDGHGVVDSPSTPGGCWTHYSAVDASGFRTLVPGQSVQLEWERADQDGYAFRAVRVVPERPDDTGTC